MIKIPIPDMQEDTEAIGSRVQSVAEADRNNSNHEH